MDKSGGFGRGCGYALHKGHRRHIVVKGLHALAHGCAVLLDGSRLVVGPLGGEGGIQGVRFAQGGDGHRGVGKR